MSPIARRTIALIVAFLCAFAILALEGKLVDEVTPPHNVELWLTLIGWLLASYTGGAIASRMGGRGPSFVFIVVMTAWTVANLNNVPSPAWLWVSGVVGVPLAALGAAGESITLRGP